MTSIIIYSLYVMPCVHLHRRGHWTFYFFLMKVLTSIFLGEGSSSVIGKLWLAMKWAWKYILFPVWGDAFSFEGELVYLQSFISDSKMFNFFLFGDLDSNQWHHVYLHLDRCAALDRKLLNPSFHLLRTWNSSNIWGGNWLPTSL